MSASKAAKLILTLVDQVSKPARGIVGALQGVNKAVQMAGTVAMAPARVVGKAGRALRRHATDVSVAGTAMTIGLTKAGRAIYEMEDTLNEIEGRRFGKKDIFHLADGTEMTRKAFRKSVTDLVTTIDKESPRNAGEIAKAYNQLVQAGLSHEQVHAILPVSVDFAIAGNYDTEEAADRLTNVMTSMQMPMATLDQASASAKRASDTIAFAANITNSNVQQMTEAFKYAAPSAAALGIDIEQLAAMFVIQAQRGIKASEAGVSIRSMLTRMVRPTKMAATALASYNIDLADYLEKSKEITSSDVTNALQLGGLDARAAAGEIDKILKLNASTAEKVRKITAAITKSVGDNSTMSADTISESVREVLYSFGENLDVERLIEDMQKANIAVSDFFKIFDVRQGARTLSLFSDDLGQVIERIRKEAGGFAEAMSDVRMQGIVGAVQRIDSALFGVLRAAADSGVLDALSNAFEKFAAALNKLAKVDPVILEVGTYAAIAAAAMAPLGFALAGITAAASLLINPLAWVAAGLGYLAYLNFDGIVSYVKSFGSALVDNLGPRTTALINNAADAAKRLFTSFSGDFSGAGSSHGAALARGIETGVVAIQNAIARTREVLADLAATPEFKSSINMLGSFFNTVKEFGGAAQRVFSGLGSGISSFASSFMENLSPDTVGKFQSGLQSLRDYFSIAMDGMASGLDKVSGYLSTVSLNIDSAAAKAGKLAAELVNGVMNADYAGMAANVAGWFRNADAMIDGWKTKLREAGMEMVQSLWDGAVAKFEELLAWARGIPGRIKAAIGRIDLSSIISLPSIFGGGSSEATPGASNDNVAGARAKGGPVKKGLTYLVGEEGPEPFTPTQNGHITSNRDWRAAASGGRSGGVIVQQTNHIHLSGRATKEDAEELTRALDRQLNRSAQVAFGNLKYGDA